MVSMPCGLDRHFYLWVLPLVVIEIALFRYAFLSDLRTCQAVIGLLGLWWCLAALWVEVKIEHAYPGFQYDRPADPEMKAYKPFCDFAPWATCSKVLMSPPGRFLRYFGVAKQLSAPGGSPRAEISALAWARNMIDVPNPTLGVLFFACHLFYPALLLIPVITTALPWLFFMACLFVGGMTIWLAYNLFFVLRDFCIVCVSMYVANFALIPMMYKICLQEKLSLFEFHPFFGTVPNALLYPFLVLDLVMLVAVLALYLRGPPAHAREPGYLRLLADDA